MSHWRNCIIYSTFYHFCSGHFNFTLMLGDKGFNEYDMYLLKHLIHNKKPLAFVRTQCDTPINSAVHGEPPTTFNAAFESVQSAFQSYMEDKVLSEVQMTNMGKLKLRKSNLSLFRYILYRISDIQVSRLVKNCRTDFEWKLTSPNCRHRTRRNVTRFWKSHLTLKFQT